VLDRAVERVLKIILRSPTFKGVPFDSKPDLDGHAKLARRAGAEGMVLLKNDGGSLPMTADKKVALFGNAAYDTITGGTGSGDVNEAYTVSVYQGLSEAGYPVDQYRKNEYEKYIASEKSKQPPTIPFFPKPPIPEMKVTASAAKEAASANDFGVFVLGRNSGEFADRKVEDDFDISANERATIKALSDAFRAAGKKFVVVLNIGGAIETASWRDNADAILLAWQPGQEGGHSIADVLAGKVNPSGRLAVSFPAKYSDVPSSKTFPGHLLPGGKDDPAAMVFGQPAEAIYDEGIYVGYRYYSTFGVDPAYEFGYGLSYTTFELSGFSLRGNGDKGQADVRVRVTNTGKVAGRDVVQVYVGGHGGTKRELKAFAKTKLLKPGESEELRFQLTPADLASFYTKDSAWIATKGTYSISAGGTSSGGGLGGSFELKRDIVVKKTARLLTPKKDLTELAAPAKE